MRYPIAALRRPFERLIHCKSGTGDAETALEAGNWNLLPISACPLFHPCYAENSTKNRGKIGTQKMIDGSPARASLRLPHSSIGSTLDAVAVNDKYPDVPGYYLHQSRGPFPIDFLRLILS
jgi:hypothetical protein